MAENDHKRGKDGHHRIQEEDVQWLHSPEHEHRDRLHCHHHLPRDLSPSDGPFGCVRPSVDLTGPLSPWRWFWASRPARPTPVWAPDDVVSQARYVPSGPAKIQLLTMISNRNGSGGHSALLIDGPERVLFDPAGSWRHPDGARAQRCPFRHVAAALPISTSITMHARPTTSSCRKLDITAGQAAALIELVEAYGPVPAGRNARQRFLRC